MTKWKRVNDGLSGDRLEMTLEDGTTQSIHLPVRLEGRAKKDDRERILELYGRKQKTPNLIIGFCKYMINPADALNGKKIRVTIEVLEK